MRSEINYTTWEKVYSYIFDYQKKELLSKCDPSNFMNPYNHDKIAIANEIILQLNQAYSLIDLKRIRSEAVKLNVYVDSLQIYEYLCKICNPTNYTGKKEEFQTANNLYERVLNSNKNYEELEAILEDARGENLGILETEIPVVKKIMSRFTIAWLVFGVWEILHLTLYITKGTLYNSSNYFFPFQTTNVAKYDSSEFFIYGIIFPLVIYSIIRFANESNRIKR